MRHLRTGFRRLHQLANRRAGFLFLLGLFAVAWRNWRHWQRDRALLQSKASPEPRPPLASWPELPLVTVLVAAWNEAAHIERHIESFLALRYPHKELVLCAGGTDGTHESARHYTGDGVIVLEQKGGEGKQRALARAFLETTGKVIFLTDADCVLTDDAFERTVYPVAAEIEQVCTGASQPLAEQMHNPFVTAQAAAQLYSALAAPPYTLGLLGRNCAVQRGLLERTQGLAAPAPTGTDYVLAKVLIHSGARIRHLPQSRIGTDYPQSVGEYLRQQRRWLRNVALHGWRFGACNEVAASMRTSLAGVAMLVLPFVAWLTRTGWLGTIWSLLFVQALLSRFRYRAIGAGLTAAPLSLYDLGIQPVLLLLDFWAWTQTMADYFVPQRQEHW